MHEFLRACVLAYVCLSARACSGSTRTPSACRHWCTCALILLQTEVVALRSYTAQKDDELSFEKGAVLRVHGPAPEADWYTMCEATLCVRLCMRMLSWVYICRLWVQNFAFPGNGDHQAKFYCCFFLPLLLFDGDHPKFYFLFFQFSFVMFFQFSVCNS